MDKKDIYEHLANIYLDASLRRKKKVKRIPTVRYVVYGSAIIVAVLVSSLTLSLYKRHRLAKLSQTALVLVPDTIKINFHFDPAKKEIFSVDLKRLNLAPYNALGFSIKKADYETPAKINMRVEFISQYRETSEKYLMDISDQWQEFKIQFSDFKDISDWSSMARLSFIVEEWNVNEKYGVVYIDNIRFLK